MTNENPAATAALRLRLNPAMVWAALAALPALPALAALAFFAALAPAGVCLAQAPARAADNEDSGQPIKVYVPYEKLKAVFENEKAAQGVFLPYADFQRLWQAAQAAPAGAGNLPGQPPYILSTARFTGHVGLPSGELATMQLELTVDILTDDWADVPLGLGEVAVVKANFLEKAALNDKDAPNAKTPPLLRVVGGQYTLLTRGKGRRVLHVDFVRQLLTRPGLNVLSLKTPPAVITTLDLLIPDENMKVDVTPMLAASTSQIEQDGKKVTKLQAFLGAGGAAGAVEASWRPTAQTGEELEPVIISEQLQHVHVAEALVSYDVTLNYDIRRRGVDTFTVQLPGEFRVTAVEGANISKWDIVPTTQPAGRTGAADKSGAGDGRAAPARTGPALGPQMLTVKLFAPAKDKYPLLVKMERFLQDNQAQLPLAPIVTLQALGSRQSGLLAISHSPRRSVELRDRKNLAQVDVGRLPDALRALPDVVNYRFISTDYAGTLAIDMVEPRISAVHVWGLGVDTDRMELQGQLSYTIERVGVFQLAINLPEPWEVLSVGPADLVERYEFVGAQPGQPGQAAPGQPKGKDRMLNVLFRSERTGPVNLTLTAQAPRPGAVRAADWPVEFAVPLADAKNLQRYQGQVILLLAEQLRAEVEQLNQLNALPLSQAASVSIRNTSPAMAFDFRTIDRAKPAGPTLSIRIAVKPAQVSAVVDRLVNIQPGSIEQEAVVQYHVQYAPVDTFFVKMPAALADAGIEISGANIKEKQRIKVLPADQASPTSEPETGAAKPAGGQTPAPAGTYYIPIVRAMRGGSGELIELPDDPAPPPASAPETGAAKAAGEQGPAVVWAYYRIVLQAPVVGDYQLKIQARRSFLAAPPGPAGATSIVDVEPILAAGRLSDQNGHIAIAKAQTLAIGEPKASKNLIGGDPGSPADLPVASHRAVATLAFRYNSVPWALSLPVAVQKEADVFTVIATAAIIEQVIARDGTVNTHATFLLSTNRSDRLPFTLPPGAAKRLFEVKLNGSPAQLEDVAAPGNPDQRIVRLPPSAGAALAGLQVTRSVLEISYGQDHLKASTGAARELTAVQLPADVPVEQTVWRVWAPQDDLLLAHDRGFAQLPNADADQMLAGLTELSRQPGLPNGEPGSGSLPDEKRVPLAWAFTGQGQPVSFLRPGSPGKLSVWLAPQQGFAIACWAIVLVVGLVMMRLSGYERSLLVLAMALGLLVVRLFAPLLVYQFAVHSVYAAVLVALLWLAQWVFGRSRKAAAAPGQPAEPTVAKDEEE